MKTECVHYEAADKDIRVELIVEGNFDRDALHGLVGIDTVRNMYMREFGLSEFHLKGAVVGEKEESPGKQ